MSTLTANNVDATQERQSFRRFVWICLAMATLKLAIQIIGNILAQRAGYGIFRDEMYYLICGRHLAFGYVDQPPMVALQARLTEILFGYDHMWSLRLLSALAGALKVFLTGALVWAMGLSSPSGNRRAAAALAMLAVIVAGVYLGTDSFLSMNSFEGVFWIPCALALVRIVEEHGVPGRERVVRDWWIVLGISAGLGIENKWNIVFFLLAVLAALLLTPQRRILASRWFAVAVGLIVALALPNLLWEMHYHWPTLEWLVDVSKSNKDVKLPPLQFLAGQIMMLNPFTFPLWISGVFWLLLARAARPFRFLGILYPLYLLMMMAMHAKDYYLAPVYVVYYAAGGLCWLQGVRVPRWRNLLGGAYALLLCFAFVQSVPFSIPILPPQQFVAYEKKIGFTPKDSENHDATILPQFYADRFGWQEMVEKVARIYNSLPPQERAVTGIYAGNYGEASAINLFGPKYGLPVAISGHQTYWLWGPHGYTGQEMIIINGATPAEMRGSYASCTVADVNDNPLAMPWEHNNIYLCHGRKATYQADWKDFKHYY
ncbi:MAG: glycosyltransferase family 39 protein [Acidobacteriota bacterium]